jgi:hypothetical protein
MIMDAITETGFGTDRMSMSPKTALNLSMTPMLGPHVMRGPFEAMRPDQLRSRAIPILLAVASRRVPGNYQPSLQRLGIKATVRYVDDVEYFNRLRDWDFDIVVAN